jgi:(p)ppGpp synthase/HD superfamily hydrolase
VFLNQALGLAVIKSMSYETQVSQSAFLAKVQAFAADKHSGQNGKRPGQTYMDHVETVVRILKKHGEKRTDVLAAAYLHDCLEKTDTTLAELMREFDEDEVCWLTGPEDSEGPEKELLSTWLLARAPIEAKRIKLADIIDNAEAIRSHDPGRWPKFRESKSKILARMAIAEGEPFERLAIFAYARAALQPQL